MRAFVYCRISDDREGAGLGVERQLDDCKALAEQLGWTIVREFTDNDISAYSGKRRPAYTEMLEALGRGEAGAVLAWHTDRLHRTPRELEEFIDVCAEGKVVVRTVKAGELDLATATGQMTARIVGAVARHEIDHARNRMVAAHAQAAAHGKPHGKIPYGYTAVFDDAGRYAGRDVHPGEAAVIREIADRILEGESLRSIVSDLNKRPHPGRPRTWNVSHLGRTIKFPVYAGIRDYKGQRVKGEWEPILTEDEHIRVCALLNDPNRRTARGNGTKWLLSGIAMCDVCEKTVRQKKSNGRPAYQCLDGHVSRLVEPVDMLVERAVVERCRMLSVESDLVDPNLEVLAREAHEHARILRVRLEGFIEQAAMGELSPESLSRIEQRLLPQIEALERKGRSFVPPEVVELLGENAQSTWDAMSMTDKRVVVRSLVEVRIARAPSSTKRFDPASVRVEWK